MSAKKSEFAVESATLKELLQPSIDTIEANGGEASFKIMVGSRKVATVESGEVELIRFQSESELANVRSALSETPSNDKQVSIILDGEKVFSSDRNAHVTIDQLGLSQAPEAGASSPEPVKASDVIEAAIAATDTGGAAQLVGEVQAGAKEVPLVAASSPEPEPRLVVVEPETESRTSESDGKATRDPDLAPASVAEIPQTPETEEPVEPLATEPSEIAEAVLQEDKETEVVSEQPKSNPPLEAAAREPAVVKEVSEQQGDRPVTPERAMEVLQSIGSGISKVSKEIVDFQEASKEVRSAKLSGWMQAIGKRAREAGKVAFTQVQQEAGKLAEVAKEKAIEGAVVIGDVAAARGKQVVRDATDKAKGIASDVGRVAVERGSEFARAAATSAGEKASELAEKATQVVSDKVEALKTEAQEIVSDKVAAGKETVRAVRDNVTETVKDIAADLGDRDLVGEATSFFQQGSHNLQQSVGNLWESTQEKLLQTRSQRVESFDTSAGTDLKFVKAARSLGDIISRAGEKLTNNPMLNSQRGTSAEEIGLNVEIDDSALNPDKNVYVVDLGGYKSGEPLHYLGSKGEMTPDPGSTATFDSVETARASIPENGEYGIVATDQRCIEAHDLSAESGQKVLEVAQTLLAKNGERKGEALFSSTEMWDISGEVMEGSRTVAIVADEGDSTLASFKDGQLQDGDISLEDLQAFHSAHNMMQETGELSTQPEFDELLEVRQLAEIEA